MLTRVIAQIYLQAVAGGQALDKQHGSSGMVARLGMVGRDSEDIAWSGLPGGTSSSGHALC